VIPGFQLADIAGGSYMAISAVTAALYRREKTHKGEYIDLAMTDSVLPFIALPFAEYQATNELRKGKFQLSGSLANYNVYKCGDGKYIALGALEPKFWNTICDRIGKPEWQEKILADEATQSTIKKELQKIFSSKKRDEWLGFFSKDDVCVTAVNDLSEIAADKYLNERKMFVDFQIGGTQVRTIAQPIKFSDAVGSDSWVAPQLGEDTYTILKELQYTDENITDMTKKNIIKSI
jgi:crotonobetainyl-CoA:carnitine CoA-transferase CaiB-like acyl-CoA transferase